MEKLVNYIKESFEELKRVNWPAKKEAIRLTVVVLSVSVGVGLYVSGLDFLFTRAVELLLNRK
jgi:preprotein translocase subunit SecE